MEKICEACGKSFKSRANKRRFCSKPCLNTWKSINIRGEKHPNWKGIQVCKNCIICNKEFRTNPNRIINGRGKTCSKECRYKLTALKLRKEKKDLKCTMCKKTFCPNYNQNASRNVFCSRKCYHEYTSKVLVGERNRHYKSKKVNCKICDKVFHVRLSYIALGYGKFCSSLCYGKWLSENKTGKNHHLWKGGLFPYGEGWSRPLRRAVRERDKDTCQSCGLTRGLLGYKPHVHHIIPRRQGGANELSNLISLCRSCHKLIECGKITMPTPKQITQKCQTPQRSAITSKNVLTLF